MASVARTSRACAFPSLVACGSDQFQGAETRLRLVVRRRRGWRTKRRRTHDLVEVPVDQEHPPLDLAALEYYGEYVDVQLFRADPAAPGGYVVVAETKGGVQLGAASPFSFTYTFTASDAAAKKVTFKSVVTIIGYKDVKPANNTVSASVSVPS